MNKKRLAVTLQAKHDAAYRTDYHNKLRGVVGAGLVDSQFSGEHDKNRSLGLCFSGLIPWGDLCAGDTRTLLIAATREGVLIEIATHLKENPQVNIGEMQLEVVGMEERQVDVGPVGTRGTIETDTGVLVRLTHDECEAHGIEPEGNSRVMWQRKHPVSAFRSKVTDTLDTHWKQLGSSPNGPSPADLYEPLFESTSLMKDYAIKLNVSKQKRLTLILSKWTFEYTVQSPAHRDVLNFALASGIGAKNGYGLGFISISEKTQPSALAANHATESTGIQ